MRSLLLLLTLSCGEPPTVVLGDNLSTSPTFNKSWVGLLGENDDELFPSFAGRSTGEIIRLGGGGNSFHSTALSAEPPDFSTDPPKTLIVQLGSNDLIGIFLRMFRNEQLRADWSPEIDQLRQDVRAVLALAPHQTKVLVTNVYDPTDGEGDVAELAAGLIPAGLGIDLSAISPELMLAVLAAGNRAIEEETEAAGATVIDIHAHFLGHGRHHDEPAHKSYVAADPTLWMRGIFDPNLRGAHELRRMIWRAISGEEITDIPTDLPPDAFAGLPPIPDDGWAKAVARHRITQEIHSKDTDLTYPNGSNNLGAILGPPQGSLEDILAVGVTGAFVVADLGETTVALDGEGADIAVVEFGSLSGGTPEPYRVSVSNDPDGPFTIIADGTGEQAFDLADAGISSARYVKVESLASEVDVLNGLGSPLAPGPEIDAIGAVHPGAP